MITASQRIFIQNNVKILQEFNGDIRNMHKFANM